MSLSNGYIKIRGAKEHNLKNIDLDIPKYSLVIVTGVSGSGKSTLVFDVLYNEGHRRFVESMSVYIRNLLENHSKPNVDSISGLSPAIAIEQKTTSRNPRSTVGTMTEIYDYLRLLIARIGVPYSPVTNLPITSQSVSEIVSIINKLPEGTRFLILSHIAQGNKGEFHKEFLDLKRQGFQRFMIDGQQYEVDKIPDLDRNKKHDIAVVVDRIIKSEDLGNRIAESVEAALRISANSAIQVILTSVIEESKDILVGLPSFLRDQYKEGGILNFSEKYACPVSGFQLTEIEPRLFSFNTPFGSCPKCQGLGNELNFDPDLIVPNQELSISEGAIIPWDINSNKNIRTIFNALSAHYKFSLELPFKFLSPEIKKILFYGSQEEIEFKYANPLGHQQVKTTFGGIIPSLDEKYRKDEIPSVVKDELSKYLSEHKCTKCQGYRLKQESLCVKVDKMHIGEISDLSIEKMLSWASTLEEKLSEKDKQIARNILKEVQDRCQFLKDVGLGYLTLLREARTLSGGETQRIRLASQIGSKLTGVLYVLDEPSIGLHQKDNQRLISTLKSLRDLGNSLIVVEHDEETILNADYVIDIGPGAGSKGGYVTFQGVVDELLKSDDSLTGLYLSGKRKIPQALTSRYTRFLESSNDINSNNLPKPRWIELKGANANNLQNVDVKIMLGTFTVVTGVSGGGKSSLIMNTLYRAIMKQLDHGFKLQPGPYKTLTGYQVIDKVIQIDQSPIGRTPRSNAATYTGAFSAIRDWFVELPESKIRGYKIGRFSFNVKGGRCEACQGDGLVKIEMHFLPDIYIKCEICKGKRYNSETLQVKYKDRSIADILDMTVEEALEFFNKVPLIKEKIQTLFEVGLSYISLGQSATTLSGGEAQRIKLAKELSRKSTGNTLYILDEPTTGLHTEDIRKLLEVLHKLVDLGNTVLVIEHNMDVIKTADYIIDVGPDGGNKGGKIVATGTPEEVSKCEESYTGQFLKHYLTRN